MCLQILFPRKRCAFVGVYYSYNMQNRTKLETHSTHSGISIKNWKWKQKMGKKLNYFQIFQPKTNCQRDDMLRSPQISVNLRVVLFATPSASRLLTLSLLSEKSYMHTRYPKHEHTRSAWGSRVEQQAASNSLVRERILFRFTPHTHKYTVISRSNNDR